VFQGVTAVSIGLLRIADKLSRNCSHGKLSAARVPSKPCATADFS